MTLIEDELKEYSARNTPGTQNNQGTLFGAVSAAVTGLRNYKFLPVSSIGPSPLNPRKYFVAGCLDISRPSSVPVRSPHGVLLTPPRALYCAECAPDVDLCLGCGCTDEVGCVEGCYWVEKDLCSCCACKQDPWTSTETVPSVPVAASGEAYQPRELICASCGVNPAEDSIYCRSCDPAVSEAVRNV